MKSFDHPHVLSLIGVSIDAGKAPFIVMPFMSNGSLLAYLRKERPHLTIAESVLQEDVVSCINSLGNSLQPLPIASFI